MLQKLVFKPTIFQQSTAYAAEGFWRDCDKIRFRYGFPQTIGGWVRFNDANFLGVCRSLYAWNTLASRSLLGVGTHLKFYIEQGSMFYDVTPLRETQMLTDPFTTVTTTLTTDLLDTDDAVNLTSAANFPPSGRILVGTEEIEYLVVQGNQLQSLTRSNPQNHLAGALVASSAVLVTDTMHGALTGDFVTFSGSGDVGGVLAADLNAEFTVFTNDPDFYWITLAGYPTSTATGGGMVTAEYQVNVGLDVFVSGLGWGNVPWGAGSWGGGDFDFGLPYQLRIWNQQNFGEDLVYGPRGGPIYYWDATNELEVETPPVRGVDLSTLAGASGVPVKHNDLMITESRFLLAFGVNPIGSTVLDPMLIRWSDQELIQDWTPTPTNLAGDLRLALGSEIICAVQTRQEILVWTNRALYSLQFNESLGFTQQLIADNISIAGPNSVVVANSVVYWMGSDKFYTYTGRSQALPSTVESYVFDRANRDQLPQTYAGSNESFDEVWWFYPSDAGNQIDSYVTYNYVEDSWYYGNIARTAWLDSGVRPKPLATNANRLYQHETGVTDGSTEPPSIIDSYIESSDFDLDQGNVFMFLRRMLPDISFEGSTNLQPTVTMSLGVRKASGAVYRNEVANSDVYKPVGALAYEHTEQIWIRARGRQAKFRVESVAVGTAWRLGTTRLEMQPDGERA